MGKISFNTNYYIRDKTVCFNTLTVLHLKSPKTVRAREQSGLRFLTLSWSCNDHDPRASRVSGLTSSLTATSRNVPLSAICFLMLPLMLHCNHSNCFSVLMTTAPEQTWLQSRAKVHVLQREKTNESPLNPSGVNVLVTLPRLTAEGTTQSAPWTLLARLISAIERSVASYQSMFELNCWKLNSGSQTQNWVSFNRYYWKHGSLHLITSTLSFCPGPSFPWWVG